MADDFDRACGQVGQFLYHFAALEKEVDQALAHLLKFTPGAANLITSKMSFATRFQFVSAVTLNHFRDKKEKPEVKAILDAINEQSKKRNLLAHSQFEPLDSDGVRFVPVRQPSEEWTKQDFETHYADIQSLAQQLKEVIAKVNLPKDYNFDAEAGMLSSAGSSPHALLYS